MLASRKCRFPLIKTSHRAVSVHTAVGFNVKYLCQRVENASFHHSTQHLSPHQHISPLMLICQQRMPVSIILYGARPLPPCQATMLIRYSFSLLIFTVVRFSDLIPECFNFKDVSYQKRNQFTNLNSTVVDPTDYHHCEGHSNSMWCLFFHNSVMPQRKGLKFQGNMVQCLKKTHQ